MPGACRASSGRWRWRGGVGVSTERKDARARGRGAALSALHLSRGRALFLSAQPKPMASSRLLRIGGATALGLGAYAAYQATRKEEVPVDVR